MGNTGRRKHITPSLKHIIQKMITPTNKMLSAILLVALACLPGVSASWFSSLKYKDCKEVSEACIHGGWGMGTECCCYCRGRNRCKCWFTTSCADRYNSHGRTTKYCGCYRG